MLLIVYVRNEKDSLFTGRLVAVFGGTVVFPYGNYTSLITLEPQPIQIKSLSVVYLFLAMNNQLIGWNSIRWQGEGYFLCGFIGIFFLTVVLCMGFTLTNLYVCLGLLVVIVDIVYLLQTI